MTKKLSLTFVEKHKFIDSKYHKIQAEEGENA